MSIRSTPGSSRLCQRSSRHRRPILGAPGPFTSATRTAISSTLSRRHRAQVIDMPHTAIELHDGVRVAVNDIGPHAGFPIVVHHGMIASIRDTALFASLVGAGRRVILLARPGYGDSSPVVLPNVAGWGALADAALDALHVGAFDILGISSGAPYAYALAARCPDRTRDVFIFSGTPALYDARVAALWPYPLDTAASLADLQDMAHSLF